MNLLFVVPDKEKDLGNLEFGGPEQASREDKKRVGRQEVVVQRRYKLFSDVQRADDIEVVIPAQAGEKHFDYMEPVQLVNPWVTAEGYAINGNGYIDFIIHADDIIKEERTGIVYGKIRKWIYRETCPYAG